MKLNLFFLGGTADDRNLTGSSILVVAQQRKEITRIMVDAGLYQGGFKNALVKNREILNYLDPRKLDYVILTHSHIDHSGRLPLLVKYGFGGTSRIICTKATNELLGIMLEDSARIQSLEAKTRSKMNKEKKLNFKKGNHRRSDQRWLGVFDKSQAKKKKNHSEKSQVEPLYSMEDALETSHLIKNDGFAYEEWIKLSKDISLKLYPSGHVLGGAICVLKFSAPGKDIFLCFSGDLGRADGEILPPPKIVKEPITYFVIESTYGGKLHPKRETEIDKLKNLVRSAVEKKRKIIIPSFALERAQEIIYLLSLEMSRGQLPSLPIYLDSPMAAKITNIYASHWKLKMFEGQEILGFNPFDIEENKFLKIVSDQKESAELVKADGPYIVIAGSGMCDAGRVRNYLRQELSNPNSIICLVGYMAENTLGRRIKDGLPVVRMNSQDIMVRAEIANFESFSAHADSAFLTSYTKAVMENSLDEEKTIFINHGEDLGAACLKRELMEILPNVKIVIPKLGWEVELT